MYGLQRAAYRRGGILHGFLHSLFYLLLLVPLIFLTFIGWQEGHLVHTKLCPSSPQGQLFEELTMTYSGSKITDSSGGSR